MPYSSGTFARAQIIARCLPHFHDLSGIFGGLDRRSLPISYTGTCCLYDTCLLWLSMILTGTTPKPRCPATGYEPEHAQAKIRNSAYIGQGSIWLQVAVLPRRKCSLCLDIYKMFPSQHAWSLYF
jgi:hypothetical protein